MFFTEKDLLINEEYGFLKKMEETDGRLADVKIFLPELDFCHLLHRRGGKLMFYRLGNGPVVPERDYKRQMITEELFLKDIPEPELLMDEIMQASVLAILKGKPLFFTRRGLSALLAIVGLQAGMPATPARTALVTDIINDGMLKGISEPVHLLVYSKKTLHLVAGVSRNAFSDRLSEAGSIAEGIGVLFKRCEASTDFIYAQYEGTPRKDGLIPGICYTNSLTGMGATEIAATLKKPGNRYPVALKVWSHNHHAKKTLPKLKEEALEAISHAVCAGLPVPDLSRYAKNHLLGQKDFAGIICPGRGKDPEEAVSLMLDIPDKKEDYQTYRRYALQKLFAEEI